jgi:IS5 family transposase
MSKILPFQAQFRPVLPTIIGNVDYQRFERQLVRMDEILRESGAEERFVELSLEQFEGTHPEATAKEVRRRQQHSYRALRCTVLFRILGGSYREMSRRLAECALFQWFCGLDAIGGVRVPAKSTLQDYAHWLPAEQMEPVIVQLLQAALGNAGEARREALRLANQLELDRIWLDSSCVKAAIHFPVDWVLLRDGCRTLLKATILIRRHGLKKRMEDPALFLRRMNRLCMEMTHTGRKAESKKARKRVLRQMKKLTKVIQNHALRHRDLLDLHWEETDWTRPQVEQVLGRMDGILLQLPEAIRQAHERIIGQRLVKNQDKILSLYEPEVDVIVRGKAGAEVEFGNSLLLVEQAQGLIVDWQLHEKGAPADNQQLEGVLERVERRFGRGTVKGLGADRGYDSKENRELLAEWDIYNGICPRSPRELKKRSRRKRFRELQTRRGQTEGRIGIFKNDFLGRPLRAKGPENRELAVLWSVLAHNLWVLARQEVAEGEEEERKAA